MSGQQPWVDRRSRRPVRAEQSTRPPRYRLLSAAARIPQREPETPWVRFESDCPACGRVVMFTQVLVADSSELVVEEHDCV